MSPDARPEGGPRAVADSLQPDARCSASGRRVGAFVVFADDEGVRHAVRLGAVLTLSDGDPCQDTTVVQLPGGRALLVRTSLEEVLRWFI